MVLYGSVNFNSRGIIVAMKIAYQDDGFIVIDDFIEPSLFESLYDFVCMRDYKHINTEGKVTKVWRLRDGFPLRSVDSYFKSYQNKNVKENWEFPVNNVMDQFSDALDNALPLFKKYIGVPQHQWNRFSVTSWMYPQGTGLSLHEDSGPYSGAYTFFMNKSWNIHWGGQLMILPQSAKSSIENKKKVMGESKYRLARWVDPAHENEAIFDVPTAITILPRPNRLVIMSNDVHHLVSTVNNNAGDSVRKSIAGFFELASF